MKVKNPFFSGLMAAIGIFITGTILFVLYSSTLSWNLVSDQYYADEIAYQDHIDRLERTLALPEPVNMDYAPGKGIILVIPGMFPAGEVSGTILLFRPSDRGLDRRYDLRLDHEGVFVIPDTDIPRGGLWKLKVTWKAGGIEYYSEKEFIL